MNQFRDAVNLKNKMLFAPPTAKKINDSLTFSSQSIHGTNKRSFTEFHSSLRSHCLLDTILGNTLLNINHYPLFAASRLIMMMIIICVWKIKPRTHDELSYYYYVGTDVCHYYGNNVIYACGAIWCICVALCEHDLLLKLCLLLGFAVKIHCVSH